MSRIRECRDGLLESAVTDRVVGAFRTVREVLGHGYPESVYQRALGIELTRRGVEARLDAPVEVTYGGSVVGVFRADLLIERRVVVGIHAGRAPSAGAEMQLRHVLRAAELDVALLLHFGPRPACRRVLRSGAAPAASRNVRRPPAGRRPHPLSAAPPPAPGPCPARPPAAYPTP